MKRALVLVLALAFVVVAATLVFTNSPAEAKKPFDNGDLDGSYAWVNTEISLRGDSPGVVTYCNAFGTIEFFGDGTASNDSTNRCTTAEHPEDLDLFTFYDRPFLYSMEPDGNFLLWEDGGSGSQTHCRLVDKGAMIICDGTSSQPDILSMSAVAVRQ
jgi:hypothetical protein